MLLAQGGGAFAQTNAPASTVANAQASLERETGRISAAIDSEAGRIEGFLEKSPVAKDKSMQTAGLQAKALFEREITRLLAAAKTSVPSEASLEPAWGANTLGCSQGQTGTSANANANCSIKGGGNGLARAAGDGAKADLTVARGSSGAAKALGAQSIATASAGDGTRIDQKGNSANAFSVGGGNASATSGNGDYEQMNNSTAFAADRSLATSDITSGVNNRAFAGATKNGEARAMSRAGDRNLAMAFGADGNNDGNLPGGSRAITLIGFDNTALSISRGANSAATTNAGYGDRHRAAARAGANSQARADAAQGEDNFAYSQADDHAHALSYTSYGDNLVAISKSRGDGGTGPCAAIGRPQNSGETNYPPDACSTASARSVDGVANTAIAISDKAKSYSVAERGARNISLARALNGGDIIWNTTESVATASGAPGTPFFTGPQAPNPHAGMKAECPWPLPPLPQAQQACGNATAKASYGDGNLAVAVPNGDHAFTWSEASGGSYNQTLATATGANPQARSRAIYTNYSTAKSNARDGGKADSMAVTGFQNVAISNAIGKGSVANARASGPYSRATAAASGGGTATAVHNTATTPAFMGSDLQTKVSCSGESVAYAMIGSGQTCGKGF